MPQISDSSAEIALANVVVGRDPEDMRAFGTKGAVTLGKHMVGTGEDAHVTSPFLMDVLRPHVIVITGKRGQGKCLLPGARVLLANGEEKKIDEIFAEVKHPDPDKDEEIVECSGISVVSVDLELNMVSAPVSHVYKRRINEKVIVVKTKSGKEIICTREHPLMSIEDEIIWRAADELAVSLSIGTRAYSMSSSYGQLIKQCILGWDEITGIHEIDYNGNVYDLTVPEHHNFVANGIVCHNSYSMGIIAEELKFLQSDIRKNLCGVIIDTQGIFWSMKQPNDKQHLLLEKWRMNSRGIDVKLYVPESQKYLFEKAAVPFDGVFSISPDELSVWQWLKLFSIEPSSKLGILLQQTIKSLPEGRYGLDDIIAAIRPPEGFENEAMYLQNLFAAAESWGIFGTKKMPEILESGKISVVDISLTPDNVRALLVSIICSDIFERRTIARRREEASGEKSPMCWIFVDEAHNFIPSDQETIASDILLKISREGRQPGLSLVLATQRPERIHEDVLAQTDLLIAHRLTSKGDIGALKKIMQTYVAFPIEKYMAELPRMKGTALILDDNSERLFTILMRPRYSSHAGDSPVAV